MTVARTMDSLTGAGWAAYARRRHAGVSIGHGLVVHGLPLLKVGRGAKVTIGDDVTLTSRARSNPVGLNRRCSIAAEPGAEIVVGNGSGFSSVAIFAATSVTVGAHVTCGGNVSIWDTDFHPHDHLDRRRHRIEAIRTAPVVIEDDVFIGASVIVLKGSHIGARTIVGAASVVAGELPPDAICAGNPARPIRAL